MGEKVQPPAEPKQKTLKGTEIPVPKRGEVMDAFKKIVRPAKPKT
jgi:hypothetical protein